MKSLREKNVIEMYSTHNEGKSVVAERFMRTLKKKIHRYKTSLSKNVYIDKLADIVNKYNNTYHRTIKMKPVDVKSSTYIDSSNDQDPELVILLECQNIKTFLQKAKFQIGLKKFLLLQQLKILLSGYMLLGILKAKKLLERFTKMNSKNKSKSVKC